MGQVMIECPKTGQSVPTGISMDEAAFASSTVQGSNSVPCPACGQMHTWSKKNAHLAE